MRIHILTTRLNIHRGGSHHNCIAFVRALRKIGHEVSVHTYYSDGNDPPEDIHIDSHDGERSPSFVSTYRRVADILHTVEHDADVFLLYGHFFLWGAGLYRKTGKVPVTVYLDNFLDSMGEAMRQRSLLSRLKHILWERAFGRSLVGRIDALIAVSPYLRDVYIGSGFSHRTFVVVPNAFDFRQPHESVPHGGIHLLYAGRLTQEKGVDTLLAAASSLPCELDWQLRIIGEGPMRDQIEKLAGLDDRISVEHWASGPQLSEAYGWADIFVHPALWPEPFGRTIVEAMHAGIPVIVPQKGAAMWLAEDAGFSFKNGDQRTLLESLVSLMGDTHKRAILGESGKLRAAEFSSEKIAVQLATVLRSTNAK
jgi:glycosyltransferase involved in cell wall biosynthesis